eukprot:798025_1
MQDTEPDFELDLADFLVLKSGSQSFEFVHRETREVYYMRAPSQKCLDSWHQVLRPSRQQEEAGQAIAEQPSGEKGVSASEPVIMRCPSCKNDRPLSHMYAPDAQPAAECRLCLVEDIHRRLVNPPDAHARIKYSTNDMKDLLPTEEFLNFLDKRFEILLTADESFTSCVACKAPFQVDGKSADKQISEDVGNDRVLKNMIGLDNRPLSKEGMDHFLSSRFRCRVASCRAEFCRLCGERPYHCGFNCAAYKDFKTAPKCRFCLIPVTADHRMKDPPTPALEQVCDKEECGEKASRSCTRTLRCGHSCGGVKDELECLPCLQADCPRRDATLTVDTEEMCAICTDEVGTGPAVILGCNHVFHHACIEQRLKSGYPGARITFTYASCPLCKVDVAHPLLDDVLIPLRHMQQEVIRLSVEQLKKEGLEKDEAVVDKDGRFYNDPEGFAMHHFAFFQCFECEVPYFAGAHECGPAEAEDEFDARELICNDCQDVESLETCEKHGMDWIQFKCRYCCTVASFHCWQKCHFCVACHKGSVWDKLSTYSTGKNKKKIEEYPQCDGLKQKIEKCLAENKGKNRKDVDAELVKLTADSDLCPLKVRHPPSGFEFGLGCTMCADKDTEASNERVVEIAKRQVEQRHEKLRKLLLEDDGHVCLPSDHLGPGAGGSLGDTGILHYIGSFAGTEEWENPAEVGLVDVVASSISSDSKQPPVLCGNDVVRWVTRSEPCSWFSINLKKRYVLVTHYALRHYSSWDTEALRNWVLEGTNDDKIYNVIVTHRNDETLSRKGAIGVWKLNAKGARYRKFRIRQTGPNSNNHSYLSCSGIELYGQIFAERNISAEQAILDTQAAERSKFFSSIGRGRGGRIEMRYQYDLDEHGVFFNLGSDGGSRPWENPAKRGLCHVLCSSLMQDSVPAEAIVGREMVRCVTKPEHGAWFAVNLIDKYVDASHYTLRHYSSWDTEALRTWVLEGSNDGQQWDLVRSHVKDKGLSGKGKTKTWALDSRGKRYQMWRIRQTGVNSNNHKYLSLSGFELYGVLYTSKRDEKKEKSRAVAADVSREQQLQAKKRLYEVMDEGTVFNLPPANEPFSEGVIFHLGTHFGTRGWQNPGLVGQVRCSSSVLCKDSDPATVIAGRQSSRCVTQPLEHSWFSIDLINKFCAPTHYSLKHYVTWDTEALRNWVLEASLDGRSWTQLRHHRNDSTIVRINQAAMWALPSSSERYRIFRIRQTGINSNKHHYLALAGFELYGSLFVPKSVIPDGGIAVDPNYAMQPGAGGPGAMQPGGVQPGAVHQINDQAGHIQPAIERRPSGGSGKQPGAAPPGKQAPQVIPVAESPAADEDPSLAFIREMAEKEKLQLWNQMRMGNPIGFGYASDFDENGIMFFLGTDSRTREWKNPGLPGGAVLVTSSVLFADSEPAFAIVGRSVVRCVTTAVEYSWFCVDFQNCWVEPTQYTLRHYSSWESEALRNWVLEASSNNFSWHILSRHVNDKHLKGKGASYTWTIKDKRKRRFRFFRIRQTGLNSNKHLYLSLSGLEFYGKLHALPPNK